MRQRIQKGMAGVAALAALALGGSVVAQAASTPSKAPVNSAVSSPEPTSGPDTDTIQSGDQTTPDSSTAVLKIAGTNAGTPEPSGTSESAAEPTESAGEAAPSNDGPGGHADETGGNANAAHDFQGVE
jgi:hypothetical protein